MVQDLSRAARSSNFAQSKVDVAEAFELGLSAHMRSADPGFTAQVVGVRRGQTAEGSYDPRYFAGPAAEFANFVKTFPQEWILPDYQGITEEALDYFRPLVAGEPDIIYGENGLPKTVIPYNLR